MSNLTIDDLRKRFYDGATPVAQGGDGTGIVTNDSRVVNQYVSQSAIGSATGATAGTTLNSTITVAATGYYRVKCFYGYGATAEATTPDNFKLTNTGVDLFTLIATVGNANTMMPMQEFMINLTAGNLLRLNVGATNSSAGAIYKGMLVIDRLS